jgi:pSer/pThr/pTyr-binding forkhead associated (FHA) protein
LRLPTRRRTWFIDSALLEAAELTLGRSSDCELVFGDDTVSRHHARLELRDGRWFLVDLDSSNGTLVNGRRVHDVEVRPGDRIRLGAAGFTL